MPGDIVISTAAPTLTFDDTSGTGTDYRMRLSPNDTLSFERWDALAGAWEKRVTMDNGGTNFLTPAVFPHGPLSGTVDFRIRRDGEIWSFELRPSGGTVYDQRFALDGQGFVTATMGLQSGHRSPEQSHLMCWKRYAMALSGAQAAAGTFTVNIADPTAYEAPRSQTLAVNFMLATAGAPTDFSALDAGQAGTAGWFAVRVLYGSGPAGSDQVKVTFDPTVYAAGSPWVMVVFYAPNAVFPPPGQ